MGSSYRDFTVVLNCFNSLFLKGEKSLEKPTFKMLLLHPGS